MNKNFLKTSIELKGKNNCIIGYKIFYYIKNIFHVKKIFIFPSYSLNLFLDIIRFSINEKRKNLNFLVKIITNQIKYLLMI